MADLSHGAAEVEQALRQILQLLDITRDIERNQEDARFAKNGGEIIYAFDENIFEMFVRPWIWKARTATFYSSYWLKRSSDKVPGAWSSVASQSAMLAAEYLLSGKLPGQRPPVLFLTDGHRGELKLRIADLAQGLQERAKLLSVEKNVRRPRRPPYLDEDLESLQRHPAKWTREAKDRFVVTRVAAATAALDTFWEPIDQLQRIVSEPLRSKFRALEEEFPVPASDYGIVAENAELWLTRLRREILLRGDKPEKRKIGSLINDANSLSYVQWAAQQASREKRKVVLVTGDTLVFDTYRRWHSRVDPTSDEYLQPFALRRLVQYAPIFNMNDAQGDISDAQELFERTRAAVEVALLPFNLSLLGVSEARREGINRGREFLALKLVDGKELRTDLSILTFSQKLSAQWLEERKVQLEEITTQWQRTERIAIGSMYETLLPRLDAQQKSVAIRRGFAGGGALRDALTGFVSSLLNQIVEDSNKLWTPFAAEFIQKMALGKPDAKRMRGKPPIYLSLQGYGSELPEDWSDILGHIREGRGALKDILSDAGQALADQPEIVFVIAAALALQTGAWSDAERFADLALRSAPTDGPNAAEFEYLHGMSKRFQIGEIGPVRTEGALLAVNESYAAAKQRLSESLAHLDELLPGSDTALRRIRTKSERAALNLFYYATMALSPNKDIRDKFLRERSSNLHLDVAEGDLRACLEFDQFVDVTLAEKTKESLGYVRRQFISNLAGYAVFRTLILEPPSSNWLFTDDVIDKVDQLWRDDHGLPVVVQWELAGYLCMVGRYSAAEIVERLGPPKPDAKRMHLSIDTEIMALVGEWVSKQLTREQSNN